MTAGALRLGVPTASVPEAHLDPWLLVHASGTDRLFGFATRHPRTGGLSWCLSSPLIELDRWRCTARTASRTSYGLGRPGTLTSLGEEGETAFALLLGTGEGDQSDHPRDVAWLTACKIARHLDLQLPGRRSHDEIGALLRKWGSAYQALRRRWA